MDTTTVEGNVTVSVSISSDGSRLVGSSRDLAQVCLNDTFTAGTIDELREAVGL